MKPVRVGPSTGEFTRRAALRQLVLASLFCGWVHAPAQPAESRWPMRRIRLLVAYPPGGVSDQVARGLAEQLSSHWAVPVVVENRPGASGRIAMDELMRSSPDGYTLGFAATTALADLPRSGVNARAAAATGCPEPGAGFETATTTEAWKATPLRLTPVAGVMTTPVLIAGTSVLKAHTFNEMLSLARQTPAALRWATTGEGTTGHAVMAQVSRLARIQVVHIPYNGGGRQIADAISGHLELVSTNVAQVQLRAVEAGHLRALAVGSPRRVPSLPDVPTLGELGLGPANLDSLFGLFAPPGTPPEVVRRAHEAVLRALTGSILADTLEAVSNRAFTGSTQEFEAEVQHRLRRQQRC